MHKAIIFLTIIITELFPIGRQHGTFRSQSTQGPQWLGTSQIISEKYDITVHPDYLDINLEWEFNVGGTAPDSFTNALEIVGNLNLQKGAVVIGMLLWNGDEILKAKLKPIGIAREQYEEVVDRDSPAPRKPRDPVIFESSGWGVDNYDISIFPVSWGATRKLRFRYLVPAENIKGTTLIGYPYPFTYNTKVNINRGLDVQGFRIHTTNSQEKITDTLTSVTNTDCTGEISCFNAHQSSYIEPIFGTQTNSSRVFTAKVNVPGLTGTMAHFQSPSIETILKKVESEYVIIWRWNEPAFLREYGYMIIDQSEKLLSFLESLESNNQRCAMIIDIMGEKNLIFTMDSPSGNEFHNMKTFLKTISSLTAKPIPRTISNGYSEEEIQTMITESVNDFDKALEEATQMFSDKEGVLKHLILLTAGPQFTSNTTHKAPEIDSEISISCMNNESYYYYYRHYGNYKRYYDVFWPGVNIQEFLSRNPAQFEITASLTNGAYTATSKPVISRWIIENSSYSGNAVDMKIYAENILHKKVT
ncbi:MAG: hypothetical protein HQK83_13765 [Fibrobacteria bacterium]|nr:hypothetical protein [Fibrobacteria bacterium]